MSEREAFEAWWRGPRETPQTEAAAWEAWQARAAVQANVPDVDALAQFIRRVDGNHQMGAGLLAQNICDWLSAIQKG